MGGMQLFWNAVGVWVVTKSLCVCVWCVIVFSVLYFTAGFVLEPLENKMVHLKVLSIQ